MALFAPGIAQGVVQAMDQTRQNEMNQSILAQRKQAMDMNALAIEQARAAEATNLRTNEMAGGLMHVPPVTPAPQTPAPGQPSVPTMQFGQQAMGGQPQVPNMAQQQMRPPPIPPYRSLDQATAPQQQPQGGAPIAPPVSTAGGWDQINASQRATQPARNAEQLMVLQRELATEQDPNNKAALQRELARVSGTPQGPSAPPPMGQPQGQSAGAQQPPTAQPQHWSPVQELLKRMDSGPNPVPDADRPIVFAKMKGMLDDQYKDQINTITQQKNEIQAELKRATAELAQRKEAGVESRFESREDRLKTNSQRNYQLAVDRVQMAKDKRAPVETGDMTKTGDDYLKTIPADFRAAVKSIAEGREKISDAGYRGQDRIQLMKMVNQYNPEYNVPKNAANAGALNANTKDLAMIRPYKEMLDTNVDVAINLGKQIVKSDSKLANKSINWVKQNMGDNPDTAEYLAQIHFVQTEAARVLANPRLVGQLTDSARKDMESVVNGDMPIDATERVLNRIKKDGDNRVNAIIKEHDNLLGEFGGKKTESSSKTVNWADLK